METVKNRVQLVGNMGKDPEIKTYGKNGKVARFSVAVNEQYTNSKGDEVKQTHWHTIVAWDKLASVAENSLKKGNEVAIDGKLISGMYTAKDGTKKYYTEIVASDLQLLSRSEK